MSDFEKFHTHDDEANLGTGEKLTDATQFAPMNDTDRDRIPDKDIEKKGESKEKNNNPQISERVSGDMRSKHLSLEKKALQEEHPTPEELIALAYAPEKPKNSDAGSAMRADGVGIDANLNA